MVKVYLQYTYAISDADIYDVIDQVMAEIDPPQPAEPPVVIEAPVLIDAQDAPINPD